MIKLISIVIVATLSNIFESVAHCESERTTHKNIFLISIPRYLNNGKITIEEKNLRDSLSATYIFTFYPTSPHYVRDAGYFLDIQKVNDVEFRAKSYKTLSVYQIMDSLKTQGRAFFRNNSFYSFFSDYPARKFYKSTGEYIHMDYKDEELNN